MHLKVPRIYCAGAGKIHVRYVTAVRSRDIMSGFGNAPLVSLDIGQSGGFLGSVADRASSADLFCGLDDDPLRATNVAEPGAVLVTLDLGDELSAAGSKASDNGSMSSLL